MPVTFSVVCLFACWTGGGDGGDGGAGGDGGEALGVAFH